MSTSIYTTEFREAIYSWLSQRLELKDPNPKGWMVGNCPECGKPKFGVNIQSYKCNCFVCSYKPYILKLVGSVESLETIHEIRNHVKTFQSHDYRSIHRVDTPKITKIQKGIKLPESFKLLMFGDSEVARNARKYMRGRGFNINHLSFKGIGYCDEGPLIGSIVFPYINSGVLEYYQARRFMPIGIKFNNPEEQEVGVGKNEVLWNKDALYIYRRVILVESITNALTAGEAAVASSGKHISPKVFNELIKAPVEHYIIAFDQMQPNKCIELALKLSRYKKVTPIIWQGNEDVNSLGKAKFREILKLFKKPFTYQQLLKTKSLINNA